MGPHGPSPSRSGPAAGGAVPVASGRLPVIVDLPPYDPPRPLRSGHVQSVLPTLFRRVPDVAYRRERIDLPDGDFLDLDWTGPPDSGRVALVAHGLEGSSDRAYVRGMARALARRGWRVCAWNLRGCSGEPNRLHLDLE